MTAQLEVQAPYMVPAEPVSDAKLPYRVGKDLLITFSDALLVASLTLWAVGITGIDTSTIGGFGLVPLLPVTYFLGIICVVVSAGILLSAPEANTKRLALHVVALVVMLYGTAPLVYPEPRYAWLYKQIGVVQYIKLHGSLNSSIDIYQNWPGYFGLAAWFDRVAGIASPLTYAGWAQLFFEILFSLVIKYLVKAKALALTWREQWLTVFIFAGSNWIAQDYLSPQALGFVLSMGVFAIALHGLDNSSAARPGRLNRYLGRPRKRPAGEREAPASANPAGTPKRISMISDTEVLMGLFLVYSVLVIVHELSPYIVAIQISTLVFTRRLRRWWIAPAMIAIALGFLAPRFTFINQKYGLLNSIGAFFGNVSPPSQSGVHLSHDLMLIADSARLLSLFIWALALVGIWRRWRAGRPALTLSLLTFSPFIVLALEHYGGEALLRVYLFSLPWAACLAASALSPGALRSKSTGWILVPSALTVAIALFLPAFFGADKNNVITSDEVAASTYLYLHGIPGPVIYVDGNFPSLIGARYNLFRPSIDLLGNPELTTKSLGAGLVPAVTKIATGYQHGMQSTGYVVISRSMITYAQSYGLASATDFSSFKNALSHSPYWQVFYSSPDVTIFELRPQ